MAVELWAIGLLIVGVFIGGFGPIFLKRGSANFNRNLKIQLKNNNLIAGIILYVLSAIIFIPTLKGGDLSVLYPSVSIVYVWTSFLSVKMLGEKMNKHKWIGVILILLGVAFIGIGSK